jgi:hypothetical protein
MLIELPSTTSFWRTLVLFTEVFEAQLLASSLFVSFKQALRPFVAFLAQVLLTELTFALEVVADVLRAIQVVAWPEQLLKPTVDFGFPWRPSFVRISCRPLAQNDF